MSFVEPSLPVSGDPFIIVIATRLVLGACAAVAFGSGVAAVFVAMDKRRRAPA
jgi:hypothetical protein